mgnify:CR=1 FL=1
MNELVIVGDRVLIEPEEGEQKTESGLVLPVTVTEKEKVGTGRVVQVGPGYLMANPEYSEGEPWTQPREVVRYLPVQAQPGDLAFYLRKEAIEITWERKNYMIVHHAAILALMRPKSEDITSHIEDLLEEGE